jgi:hypothetical protein
VNVIGYSQAKMPLLVFAFVRNVSMSLNREHSSKGYKVNAGTSTITYDFYGFTVVSEAVINAITAPSGVAIENNSYDGDEAGLAGVTLPVGYYPIRGSAIDLTSGTVILWQE